MDSRPPENSHNPWKATLGEASLGIGIFILMYAIGDRRLVWNRAFLNTEDTWRETFHAGTADTALAGAGPAVFTIVGTTKTVSLVAGRIFEPGNSGSTRNRGA